MIEIFVINGTDYSLFAIGGMGALLFFAVQLVLCFKTKKTGVRLIPVYFVLCLVSLAIAAALTGSAGSVLDLSGVVAAVIFCFALLFGLSIGAAWIIYKVKSK